MSVPRTMRAMLLTGHGGPDKLQLDTAWPVPDIAPDEVLVKVGACGINNTDIWVREGAYGSADDPDEVASFGDSPLQFPLVQGADIAGVIVATGADIKTSRIGERVMVDFGIYAGTGEDVPSHDYIGSGRPGGFAEYVAVPAENAHVGEPFAKCDQRLHSWRTCQGYFTMFTSDAFLKTWPTAGMSLDGFCYLLPKLVRILSVKGCGYYADRTRRPDDHARKLSGVGARQKSD